MWHGLDMVYLHLNGSFEAVETYMNNLPQIGIFTFNLAQKTLEK